jgi:hypothetical protein
VAVGEQVCRDVLLATTDGSLWLSLVERRGWSDERYAARLGRLWVAMLVDPPADPAESEDADGPVGESPSFLLDHGSVRMVRRAAKRRFELEARYWRLLATGIGTVAACCAVGTSAGQPAAVRAVGGIRCPPQAPHLWRHRGCDLLIPQVIGVQAEVEQTGVDPVRLGLRERQYLEVGVGLALIQACLAGGLRRSLGTPEGDTCARQTDDG